MWAALLFLSVKVALLLSRFLRVEVALFLGVEGSATSSAPSRRGDLLLPDKDTDGVTPSIAVLDTAIAAILLTKWDKGSLGVKGYSRISQNSPQKLLEVTTSQLRNLTFFKRSFSTCP